MQSFLKIMCPSLVLLGLFYLFALLLKKRFAQSQNALGSRMSILDYRRIDQRTSVALIEAQEKTYLIATNPGGIAVIECSKKESS
jgi:flagellar biogenesis protein FliO